MPMNSLRNILRTEQNTDQNMEFLGQKETKITEYKGKCIWTITNWKSWLASSIIGKSKLTSDIFSMSIINEDGIPEQHEFNVIAKPFNYKGRKVLAFKLHHIPNQGSKLYGAYTFKLENKFFGLPSHCPWEPVPFDAADKIASCLLNCNHENLKLKIKLRIVVAVDDQKCLPTYSQLFGNRDP